MAIGAAKGAACGLELAIDADVYDTFDDVTYTRLYDHIANSGHTWTTFGANQSNWYIYQGTIKFINANPDNSRAIVNTTYSRQSVRALSLATGVSASNGLLANVLDDKNYTLFLGSEWSGNPAYSLRVVEDGVTSIIWESAIGKSNPQGDWRMDTDGDDVSLYMNDILLHSVTIPNRVASNATGMGIYNSNTLTIIGDFRGTELP